MFSSLKRLAAGLLLLLSSPGSGNSEPATFQAAVLRALERTRPATISSSFQMEQVGEVPLPHFTGNRVFADTDHDGRNEIILYNDGYRIFSTFLGSRNSAC